MTRYPQEQGDRNALSRYAPENKGVCVWSATIITARPMAQATVIADVGDRVYRSDIHGKSGQRHVGIPNEEPLHHGCYPTRASLCFPALAVSPLVVHSLSRIIAQPPDPDVPKSDGIPMVLQEDRALRFVRLIFRQIPPPHRSQRCLAVVYDNTVDE